MCTINGMTFRAPLCILFVSQYYTKQRTESKYMLIVEGGVLQITNPALARSNARNT